MNDGQSFKLYKRICFHKGARLLQTYSKRTDIQVIPINSGNDVTNLQLIQLTPFSLCSWHFSSLYSCQCTNLCWSRQSSIKNYLPWKLPSCLCAYPFPLWEHLPKLSKLGSIGMKKSLCSSTSPSSPELSCKETFCLPVFSMQWSLICLLSLWISVLVSSFYILQTLRSPFVFLQILHLPPIYSEKSPHP